MDEPLVSVGLQFFNSEGTLRAAIQSILSQSYQNWELILHDDGSQDRSLEIASGFRDSRIRLFTDSVNRRRSARLNESLHLAKGKYYALMDADDVSYPERLERQVSYLERHPDVDLVGTWAIVFGRAGTPLGKRAGPETHTAICARPFAGFPMAHPTCVGRLEWFRRYHYRDEAIRCEDQDLLLRSYRFSRFANVPEILLGYREEQIDLRKILTSRRYFGGILFREFQQQGRLDLAVRSVAEQLAKAVLDSIAMSTGLRYRVLQHRAQPITDIERCAWEHVWRHAS